MVHVPDLGKDLIRDFWYDKDGGRIGCEFNILPSGMSTVKPDGLRYFEVSQQLYLRLCVDLPESTSMRLHALQQSRAEQMNASEQLANF